MEKYLGEVAELYPWDWDASDEKTLPVDERSNAGVAALLSAKEAEASGLQCLAKIAQALQPAVTSGIQGS